MVDGRHILLVTFPAQGHINPCLPFAKRLIRIGVQVTFATTISAQRRMSKTSETPHGITFSTFSDGYDEGFKSGDDTNHFFSEFRHNCSRALQEIIVASASQGRPVTCLVYTILLPWAVEVARGLHIPSALLWIQPATVLGIYYYYFRGYGEIISETHKDPSGFIELPGLPPLSARDLPTLLLPPKEGIHTSNVALDLFKELVETLDLETNPKILVNTFDALEPEALKAIEKYNMIGIGPLIPSAFLDGTDPSDTSFGGDLFEKSKDYVEWLNSKPESSVVYVSFGSLLVLSKPQMEEIARALLEIRRPFLWVIREKQNRDEEKEEKEEDEERIISCMEELEQQGLIVPWCSQLEILSHPSLGCFVTHCGWNSTLESLASGVPVVAFPHWSDQGTNAKMMEQVWKIGVRVRENEEKGLVESDEVKRCIEMVMTGVQAETFGEEETRKNASRKWKDLAMDAVKEGGSSDLNLKAFVLEVAGEC